MTPPVKPQARHTILGRIAATWKEYETAFWGWFVLVTVVVGIIAFVEKVRGSDLPAALGIAALGGVLQLLGKAGFWYCVVALLCAKSIAFGLHDVARSIRLTRRRQRPGRAMEDLEEDFDELDA